MIENCACVVGVIDLLDGGHSADTIYRLALYKDTASLGPRTTSYSPFGEVMGGGYPAGGIILENRQLREYNGAVVLTWASVILQNVTIEAGGALIYRDSPSRPAHIVLSFDEVVVSKDGPFIVPLPSIEDGGVYSVQLPQARSLLR